MANETMDQKCPNCRAPLRFSPSSGCWECGYCGSKFKLEELQNLRGERKKRQETKVEYDGYLCKNCGAKILLSENTSATSCVYCRSTAIISQRLENEFSPNAIIPFRKTKEEAVAAFQKVGLRRFFAPREFTNKKNIKEIQGIYIPFWLFDFHLKGTVSGKGKKIVSTYDGDYLVTATSNYYVGRSCDIPFFDIPVDGSKHFDDALMNSIEPFDYKDLVTFDPAYLSGFLSEKYDLKKEEVLDIAIKRAETSTLEQINKQKGRYQSLTIEEHSFQHTDLDGEYVLLPVWLLNIRYKDKIYPYAMNGQTGKMIGDLPILPWKVVFFGVLLFFLFAILICLGFLLLGGYRL